MARTLKVSDNGIGHSGGPDPEQPYLKRAIELAHQKEAIVEDEKQLYIEVKEADLRVMPIRLAVKRYMESEEHRLLRETNEAEAERLIRALGPYADTPLGGAAVSEAAKPTRGRNADAEAGKRQGRTHKIEDALDRAREHLGQTDVKDLATGAAPAPFEEDHSDPLPA